MAGRDEDQRKGDGCKSFPQPGHCDRRRGGLGLARQRNGPHGPCPAGPPSGESTEVETTELLDRIAALLGASTRDLAELERTLTDGYAAALSLEAERWRLERRMTGLSIGIESGDVRANARELAVVAQRLEDNGRELAVLRDLLSELRRCADDVRVGSPARS